MITRITLALLVVFAKSALAAEPTKADLFEANTGIYQTFRIPGVVVTKRGTVLVYCEARKDAKTDNGHIDVMLRRSTDGGKTFDAPRMIVGQPDGRDDATMNNPTAIADPDTGAVHFVYCLDYARCFYIRSDDDGVTFSAPVEITAAFDELRPKYPWRVIATGPGHGIKLKSNRLLIPIWCANGKTKQSHRPSCISSLFSDDDGKTWHTGDIIADNSAAVPNPNETGAVELSDGRVMFNSRNEAKPPHRLISISKDGATHWSKPAHDATLVDVICMGSILRAAPDKTLFSNPVGDDDGKGGGGRANLTIRLSADDAKTWPVKRLLEPGVAAYSDLAVLPDGTLLCFYECGFANDVKGYAKTLRLAQFDLAWIESR